MAVMRLLGLMVNILLIRSLASGVTVSHSGDGNCHKISLCQIKTGDANIKSILLLVNLLYINTHIIGSSLDLLIEAMLVLIPEGRVAHQQDV